MSPSKASAAVKRALFFLFSFFLSSCRSRLCVSSFHERLRMHCIPVVKVDINSDARFHVRLRNALTSQPSQESPITQDRMLWKKAWPNCPKQQKCLKEKHEQQYHAPPPKKKNTKTINEENMRAATEIILLIINPLIILLNNRLKWNNFHALIQKQDIISNWLSRKCTKFIVIQLLVWFVTCQKITQKCWFFYCQSRNTKKLLRGWNSNVDSFKLNKVSKLWIDD